MFLYWVTDIYYEVNNMKIGIVTDGKYGERAFENISKIFDSEWIEVEEIAASIILEDEYELNIPDCDLYISYLRHPDQVFALAELEKPTLLGISFGIGHFKQLKEINQNIFIFDSMCSLEPTTNVFEIDTFAHFFGRPKYTTEILENKVTKVEVLRSSPCGSSKASRDFIIGKEITPDNLQEFAIRVCHECRSPRFGKTCDKELAGLIHLRELTRSLEDKNENIIDFISGIEEEYNSRITSIEIS